LQPPGHHSAVIVPEYAPRPRAQFATEAFAVNDRITTAIETTIRATEVTAYATVQSHWRPTRKWGFDRGKSALAWIRVNEDGDYIYTPDGSNAKPMTSQILQYRIDRLVADDIAILREFRRD
jgi:hypothetical protein